MACIGNDPYCPCQDGDSCRYRGPGAWPVKHWVSCRMFTVQVNTIEDRITWAAPIVRKFIGQPLSNLLRWAGPGVRVEVL